MALSKRAKVISRVTVNIVGILIWLWLIFYVYVYIDFVNLLHGIDRLITGSAFFDKILLFVIWGIYPAIVFLGGNMLLTRLFRKSDKLK